MSADRAIPNQSARSNVIVNTFTPTNLIQIKLEVNDALTWLLARSPP